MVYLIDANVLIRFFAADHQEHFEIAKGIMLEVEQGTVEVEILDSVLLEVYFVLMKIYGYERFDLLEDLKKIIALKGVVGNKVLLIEVLNVMQNKNIDFVDALICTKSKLQGYGKLSFDRDVNKKCL